MNRRDLLDLLQVLGHKVGNGAKVNSNSNRSKRGCYERSREVNISFIYIERDIDLRKIF